MRCRKQGKLATNTENPRRFDLRETIPLATQTLIALAKQPKRSWILPALTLFSGIAMAALMLELIFFPGSASTLGFKGELRSRLLADYAEDPIAARIHELRLTIVEDVLGFDDGGGSAAPAIALLMQDPVPSATPKAASPTSQPSASPVSSDVPIDIPVETASPVPGDTPAPPTAVAEGSYCGKLSITGMWIDGDDVEASVRNSGSKDVYLIKTVFEWPDVPDPAYVDWFKFDGDRYYSLNDGDSPTVSTGDHERLRKNKTRRWETDFDDEPDGVIYGSFSLTLTFDVPSQDAHCSVSGSTYRAPPAPTDLPAPTETPVPVSTDTPEPTPTLPTPTDTPEPAPTDTSTPEPTPTP